MSRDTFYITTAISYPNGKPHIGHAYELIATDALARFQRLDGKDVFFLTGTDEHGIKMLQTAKREGISPRELADRNSADFKRMATRSTPPMTISSAPPKSGTTRPRRRSGRRWPPMATSTRAAMPAGTRCATKPITARRRRRSVADNVRYGPQGTPVEWVEEESYFFRLSAYQDKLLALYESQPDFIGPAERRNEVMSFVKSGLKDLSISRTTFDWGVPVPGDEKHVMYVWVDALTNYITGVGYPDENDEKWRFWPADAHIIGKDIVRFHAVYWPAFLMSAGIPLPKRVFGHGFLFNRGEKMSKSVGNVIDPFTMVEHYGLDQVRYFFLREVPFGQDGSYSHEAIVNRTNADLANGLGNLAQRSLSMIAKNCGGVVPKRGELTEADRAILDQAVAALWPPRARRWRSRASIWRWRRSSAWWRKPIAISPSQEPWALKKTDPARMETVLWTTAEVVRRVALLCQPFIPGSADEAARPAGGAGGQARLRACPRRLCAGARHGLARAGRRVSALRRTAGRERLMLVDSHCHLDFPDFAEERAAIVARAKAAGIGRMVTISTRVKRFQQILEIAETFDEVYCSVGTHPHNAAEELDVTAAELVRLSAHPKVVAIGEAGLDYFYDKAPRDAQAQGFRNHIAAARETGLPLVIHSRDADDDMAAILEDETGKGAFPFILHCFSSGRRLAEVGVALGGYVSFSGILTFKNSAELRAIAADVPHDRLLVETDAPYLAPIPFRGKRNEPAYVAHTAKVLAETIGVSEAEIADLTTNNFFRLFGKMPRPAEQSA